MPGCTHEDLEQVERKNMDFSLCRRRDDDGVEYLIEVRAKDTITESDLIFDLSMATDETTARLVFALFTKEDACALWEDATPM